MTAKLERLNLINKLTNAYVCCKDCGSKYGVYSVGCSSSYEGTCDVCGERKSITETRDYGYLNKGIASLREGKQVPEVEEDIRAYEQGEITLKLTEDEVGFLNECLDVIVENYKGICPGHSDENPEDIALFESVEKKITQLYDDNCIKYELSPAMRAYITHYGQIPGPEDDEKWEIFRDAYNLAVSAGDGQ